MSWRQGSARSRLEPPLRLAAGVGTFELARYMVTGVEMIERTYGHLVTGADDAFRSRLDAYGKLAEADRIEEAR